MLTGMGSRERHWRMARKNEFDVCEINIGGYYMARDRGEALAAIPVFLHRRFRHGFVFVNADSGIREPKDLIGKKIGGTNFQPASNIWMRGILEEHYGVPHRQCTWVVEREEDVEFTPPRRSAHRDDRRPASGSTSCWRKVKSRPCCRRTFRGCSSKATSASCGCSPNYKDIEIEFFKQDRNLSDHARHRRPPGDRRQISMGRDQSGQGVRRSQGARLSPHRQSAHACRWPGSGPPGKSSWRFWAPIRGPTASTDANRKNLQTVQRYCHQQGLIGRMHAAR